MMSFHEFRTEYLTRPRLYAGPQARVTIQRGSIHSLIWSMVRPWPAPSTPARTKIAVGRVQLLPFGTPLKKFGSVSVSYAHPILV